ncbi:Sodium-dependent nutrient amino acid transporter 1, partial [Armadillidium nasatum]
ERDQWSNPLEFIMSCIAMSVGLGNIWRFPATAMENGGGAFLIPYLVVLFFIGRPLYYMELCMGQFASYGCVKIWHMVPAMKGIGYSQVISTWAVVTYYVSLMATTMFYFFASFKSELPWSNCPANSSGCFDASLNHTFLNQSLHEDSMSASENYYSNVVTKTYKRGLDDGLFAPDLYLALCLLGSWLVLFVIISRGVKSSGKAAYFMALFPYVVLFGLLGKGLTLPGSWKGIKYFFTPDFSRLLELNVWKAAVGQCFFSLSVGFGSIVMLSSYNDFRHNVYRDALIISVTDTGTSILAGATTFGILGYLSEEMGVENVADVLKGGGTKLAFVTYPDVITHLNWYPQIFAVSFFLMLFTLGMGSATALTGVVITVVCDNLPNLSRFKVTVGVCILGFLLGLFYVTPQGEYILKLIDTYLGKECNTV